MFMEWEERKGGQGGEGREEGKDCDGRVRERERETVEETARQGRKKKTQRTNEQKTTTQ